MTKQSLDLPQLPIELPLQKTLAHYLKLLGIFSVVFFANAILFAAYILLTPAQLIPKPVEEEHPTPEALREELLTYNHVVFEDNFDEGLSERWIIMEGTPLIIDGKLTSVSGDLRLQIRDLAFSNYSVAFDMTSIPHETGILAIEVGPSLRYAVAVTDVTRAAFWQTLSETDWVSVTKYKDFPEQASVKILVGDEFITTLLADEPFSTLKYPAPPIERFAIILSEGLFLDNVRITIQPEK